MENVLIPESNPEINTTSLKPKKTKIYIIIIIFLIAVIILFLSFFIQKTKLTEINSETFITEEKSDVEVGWVKYRNDVLGIEFQYPESWGKLAFSPIENITHLDTLNKDFLYSNKNNIRYMVEIKFSKNNWIDVKFINDQYLGENYPNSGASQYGPMDNFETLKSTKNICKYYFNFLNTVYGRNVSFSEKNNNCKSGIKTTLFFDNPDASDSNGNRYFNYKINQYFYKKLSNGYFDNLLITNHLVSYQGSESNLDSDQVITKGKPEISFVLSSTNFKEFVESIKTFTPPTPTPLVFSQNSNQDPNINTIYQYYFYLATQKLQDAYEMYQNKNIGFEKFTSWYDQVFNTNIYDIKQTKSDTYSFYVDISEKNLPISKYKVTMEIDGNKVNTLSSEKITSDEVKFDNLTAYTRLKSDKNEIVLTKNGEEIIIDRGDSDWERNFDTAKTFSNPKFSSQGNYLTYIIGGWEYFSYQIFDIKNNKLIPDKNNNYTNYYEISKDEKYIINCGEDRFAGEIKARVSSFPDLKLRFNFLDGIQDDENHSFDCFYDSSKNTVKFELLENQNDSVIKTIVYDLTTEKIIQ